MCVWAATAISLGPLWVPILLQSTHLDSDEVSSQHGVLWKTHSLGSHKSLCLNSIFASHQRLTSGKLYNISEPHFPVCTLEVIIFVSQNCLKPQMRAYNMNMLLSTISHLQDDFHVAKPLLFPSSLKNFWGWGFMLTRRNVIYIPITSAPAHFISSISPHHQALASPPFLFRKTTWPPWTTLGTASLPKRRSLWIVLYFTSGINQGDPKSLSW